LPKVHSKNCQRSRRAGTKEAVSSHYCSKLKFKQKETEFTMVAELDDFLEKNRVEIWNRLMQLKENLKPFGKMILNPSCFMKTQTSLINKINRELSEKQTDTESILKSFLTNDFIRFRVYVYESQYEDMVY